MTFGALKIDEMLYFIYCFIGESMKDEVRMILLHVLFHRNRELIIIKRVLRSMNNSGVGLFHRNGELIIKIVFCFKKDIEKY